MPTTAQRDKDLQSSFLDVVRESQAAVIDVLRVWSDIGQQLTRDLKLPMARIDLTEAVDRAFDMAEQTLAAQHQLARTLAGVATRQVDTAVDTATQAANTTVETVEGTVRERAHQLGGEPQRGRERVEQPQARKADIAEAASPQQERKFDGRTYEERSLEELRERAAELQIEGRSSMSKDELIAALRNRRQSRPARNDAPTQDRAPDRRSYEERSLEELRERARELDIEGRSSMSRDELIAALRQHSR
jgi:hypothetical protein